VGNQEDKDISETAYHTSNQLYHNDNSAGGFESLCHEPASNVIISGVRAYYGIESLALKLERISRKILMWMTVA
jgi:hypothetical protein